MVDEESKKRILADYKSSRQNYKALVSKLEQLLTELLNEHGITVHSISGRAKSRKSLAGKLVKNDSNYENLTDLTDLAGLRIITYFSEDVDKVAKIIESQFNIDLKHSVDKRSSLAADRFGYLSLHQVFSLKDSRYKLPEYKPFKGIKAELQIRSILQHAWAEIEHDLGYKNEIEVPQPIRRRFARVASILELADDEFKGIKRDLEEYRFSLVSAVKENPEDVSLNLDSLETFIDSSELIRKIDTSISKVAERKLGSSQVSPGNLLNRLARFGINTISELSNELLNNEKLIVSFADAWIVKKGGDLAPGLSIFYLWLVLLSDAEQIEIIHGVQDMGPSSHKGNVDDIVKKIVDVGIKIRKGIS